MLPGRRHRLWVVAVAAAMWMSVTSLAHARPRPESNRTPFEANKTFGLGLMLGAPTGLNGKYYLSENTAFDFALGAYHEFRHRNALQIHADFLWHPAVLATTDPFLLPFYVGIGARFLDHDDDDDRRRRDGSHFGARVPIGLLMDFNRVPIDIFFELALVVDVIVNDDGDNDHDHVDIDGAIGARYYF